MAAHADPNGTCLAGDERIIEYSGLSGRQARRIIDWFVEHGHVKVHDGYYVVAPTAPPPEQQTLGLDFKPPPDRFDEFWKIYPRKVSKAAARRAWKKIEPSAAVADIVIAAVVAQSATGAQMAADIEAVHKPHAASWLNAARWNDAVEKRKQARPALKERDDALVDREGVSTPKWTAPPWRCGGCDANVDGADDACDLCGVPRAGADEIPMEVDG